MGRDHGAGAGDPARQVSGDGDLRGADRDDAARRGAGLRAFLRLADRAADPQARPAVRSGDVPVSVVTEGETGIEQRRQHSLLERGDMGFFDSSQPFDTFAGDTPGKMLLFQFPKKLLRLPHEQFTRLCGLSQPWTEGAARLFGQFVVGLAEEYAHCTRRTSPPGRHRTRPAVDRPGPPLRPCHHPARRHRAIRRIRPGRTVPADQRLHRRSPGRPRTGPGDHRRRPPDLPALPAPHLPAAVHHPHGLHPPAAPRPLPP
ncbi:hypothetical protein AB0G85_29830 [Streptomyces sioyaensis]|uniref:AraC-like ligand-binding domain-containing protein n=1 Tax=Streptomyces sioyaensis TaxID=67364 RepID=UPI0033EF9172